MEKVYYPDCLAPFPKEIADALLAMSLERLGWGRDRLAGLSADEKRTLDADVMRLVRADDVPETPCGH